MLAIINKLGPASAANLEKGTWLGSLPPDVQAFVLERLVSFACPTGNVLFRQGDAPKGLFLLLSGEVHVVGISTAGNDRLMCIFRPGDWTGFLAVLDDKPYTLSAIAVVDSVAAHLQGKRLELRAPWFEDFI